MKTVAVVGASNDRHKFGNMAVRSFLRQGYTVIPINPHAPEIEGLRTYPTVLDVPHPIDLATIYLPSEEGLRVLADIAQRHIPEVWVNPGADSPEVIQRARELGIEPIVACSLTAIGASPEAG